MKFYNKRKTSSGEYWTTEFTANEMTNINVVYLVVMSSILSIVSAVASAILIFVTIHDLEDEGIVPSLFGALISALFLLDIYYHFIIRLVLYIMLGEQWINTLFHLNIAYLTVHLFLILFSRTVYLSQPVTDRKTYLLSICLVMAVIVYLISVSVYTVV